MKKLLFVSLFISLLLLGGCMHKEVNHPLTLIQAIKRAYPDALKWDKDARLIDAKSVDGDKRITRMNGKSSYWDITFGIPGTNKAFLVNIRDGEINNRTDITDESVVPLSDAYFITDLSKLKFDSPELLKKAMSTTKLYPIDTRKRRYIFGISKATEKDSMLVKIIGWDKKEEKMKRLQFNANTGELYKNAEGD
ncbi:hypothetical protein [Lentibacillus kapialis]|nr:hypothetical protein [Lentibacillus kapialis]